MVPILTMIGRSGQDGVSPGARKDVGAKGQSDRIHSAAGSTQRTRLVGSLVRRQGDQSLHTRCTVNATLDTGRPVRIFTIHKGPRFGRIGLRGDVSPAVDCETRSESRTDLLSPRAELKSTFSSFRKKSS